MTSKKEVCLFSHLKFGSCTTPGYTTSNYTIRKLNMNDLTIGISSIDIEATTVLIVCICFIYDYFAHTRSCNCIINILKRKYLLFFTSTSIGKCHTAMKYNPHTLFHLNFIQRRYWANPRALILTIEGATDHSCLKNHSVI